MLDKKKINSIELQLSNTLWARPSLDNGTDNIRHTPDYLIYDLEYNNFLSHFIQIKLNEFL